MIYAACIEQRRYAKTMRYIVEQAFHSNTDVIRNKVLTVRDYFAVLQEHLRIETMFPTVVSQQVIKDEPRPYNISRIIAEG